MFGTKNVDSHKKMSLIGAFLRVPPVQPSVKKRYCCMGVTPEVQSNRQHIFSNNPRNFYQNPLRIACSSHTKVAFFDRRLYWRYPKKCSDQAHFFMRIYIFGPEHSTKFLSKSVENCL